MGGGAGGSEIMREGRAEEIAFLGRAQRKGSAEKATRALKNRARGQPNLLKMGRYACNFLKLGYSMRIIRQRGYNMWVIL